MNDRETKESEATESFALEGNLGRATKWLRVLGFDAVCPAGGSEDRDYYVTTRRHLRKQGVIPVEAGNALDQVREVLDYSGATPDPKKFLSRCLACNVPVRSVQKEAVKGRVPAGVFSTIFCFSECPSCKRVYWKGSHWLRMLRALEEAGIFLGVEGARCNDKGSELCP